MKKVFFMMIFAVMIFAANQVNAQFEEEMMGPPQNMGMRPGGPGGFGGHGGHGMNSEQMIKSNVARLTKQLQLTKEQAAEIENIYKAQADARKERFEQMRKSGQRPDMQAMRAQMEKERADVDAKIAKVLTPQQNEMYKQMQAERGKGRMDRGKNHEKRGPAGKPYGGFDKMKEELGLTDEQVEQLKQMKRDQKKQEQESLKEILTPQQYEKMQQMKKHTGGKK